MINRTSDSVPKQGLNYNNMAQSQFMSDSMMFNSQVIPNTSSASFAKQSYYGGNTPGYGYSGSNNKALEVAEMFMAYYGNNSGVIQK
jgi:hypothetical protein